MLGKEIKVSWKFFEGPYRKMMKRQNIKYEVHTISRFVSKQDFRRNAEAREFVEKTFEGRRESGVTVQDYWLVNDEYEQAGEIIECWYAFTREQLKKWGNVVPNIATAKRRISLRKQRERQQKLYRRQREPTINPRRTQTVSSDTEFIERTEEEICEANSLIKGSAEVEKLLNFVENETILKEDWENLWENDATKMIVRKEALDFVAHYADRREQIVESYGNEIIDVEEEALSSPQAPGTSPQALGPPQESGASPQASGPPQESGASPQALGPPQAPGASPQAPGASPQAPGSPQASGGTLTDVYHEIFPSGANGISETEVQNRLQDVSSPSLKQLIQNAFGKTQKNVAKIAKKIVERRQNVSLLPSKSTSHGGSSSSPQSETKPSTSKNGGSSSSSQRAAGSTGPDLLGPGKNINLNWICLDGTERPLQKDSSLLAWLQLFITPKFANTIVVFTELRRQQWRAENITRGGVVETKSNVEFTVSKFWNWVGHLIYIGYNQITRIEDAYRSERYFEEKDLVSGSHSFLHNSHFKYHEFCAWSKFFACTDRTQMPKFGDKDYDKGYKARPMLDMFNEALLKHRQPGAYVSVDEMLRLYRGRTTMINKIGGKKGSGVGLKFWALAESLGSRRMLRLELYSGKRGSGQGKTKNLASKVVLALLSPFFSGKDVRKIQVLSTDNYYTSIPLALALLYKWGVHSHGVIKMRGRGARKGFPRALLAENAVVDSNSEDESGSGAEQNSGSSDDGSSSSDERSEEEEVEVIKKKNKDGLDKRFPRGSYIFRVLPWDKLFPFLGRGDSAIKNQPVSLLGTLWHDNKLSAILSTFADPKMRTWMRRNRTGKYKKIQKPISNILYSAIMDAVDVADRHLTDVGINIRTRKWYLNVFCMILSAAVVEMHSCYTEEHGEVSRNWAIRRLVMECSRAKTMPRQALVTTFPRATGGLKRKKLSGLKRERVNTPVKETSATPAGTTTPSPSGHGLRTMPTPSLIGHHLRTMPKRGHCGHCVQVLKRSTSSAAKQNKQASRTIKFCDACEMYLCRRCAKVRRRHIASA